tara:strand:+ start:1656 stop:2726 length:1071 start_codon:yes stop_codon:yes gene_type:complete
MENDNLDEFKYNYQLTEYDSSLTKDTDITSNIINFYFENPFINASGCMCRTETELNSLKNSISSSMITKTCTLKLREGNPTPRYFDNESLSINSMGLPNKGINYYLDYYSKISKNNNNKKIKFLSIGGMSLQENIDILNTIFMEIINNSIIDAIEINFSCPNLVGHPQLGYDFDNMDYYLNKLITIINNFESNMKYDYKYKQLLVGVKLPPYFDMIHFEKVADIIKKNPRVDFITCINSIGNGLYIDLDSETTVIKPKNGFGGLGGSIVKPTALANVHKFYQLLGRSVYIIGCGGISTGADAFEYILAGASLLSIGTQLVKEGVNVFNRIEHELKCIMKEKGYKRLDDFRGKLKHL